MSAQEVKQALNDMEQIVQKALTAVTERLGDLDRTNDGKNAVIVPAWALRALLDKIIYDQHFVAMTLGDDVDDFWYDKPGHRHD